jgi:hypothetical protein
VSWEEFKRAAAQTIDGRVIYIVSAARTPS